MVAKIIQIELLILIKSLPAFSEDYICNVHKFIAISKQKIHNNSLPTNYIY